MTAKILTSKEALGLSEKARAVAEEILPDVSPASVGEALSQMNRLETEIESRLPEKEDYFNLGYTSAEALLSDLSWAFLYNRLMRSLFDEAPISERAVFLPHCLADSSECGRRREGIFDVCVRCGRCVTGRIVSEALDRGYREDRIFVVGGGSTLAPIIRHFDIKALVGVACRREATLYYNGAVRGEFNVPSQMALLYRWGCRDTGTVFEWVLEAL